MKASDRMLVVLTSAAEERLAQMEAGLEALAKAAPEREVCLAVDPPGGDAEVRQMIITRIRALVYDLRRRVCAFRGGPGKGPGEPMADDAADSLDAWRPDGSGGGC